MLNHFERPDMIAPAAAQRLVDPGTAANGLIVFIFAAFGPLAILFSVGTGADLSTEQPPF